MDGFWKTGASKYMIGLDPDALVIPKANAFSSDMGFSRNMSLQKHGGLCDKEIWKEIWKAWPTIELRPF